MSLGSNKNYINGSQISITHIDGCMHKNVQDGTKICLVFPFQIH